VYHEYDMEKIIEDMRSSTKKNLILDTDTYNEIDDQFAIVYAMLSDDINLLALTAAPFRNHRARFPSDGVKKSYEEMVKVRDLVDPEGKMNIPCYCGASAYMSNIITPQPSEAAENIVRIVKETDGIVYIAAIGCYTNIASALLMDPSIMDKVVVLMLGGSIFEYPNCDEFNFAQDCCATRVLLECGVPHVVLPAEGAAERLYTNTGEICYFLRDKAGDIGNYLCDIYIREEGLPEDENGNCVSGQRTIWDVSAVAALRMADKVGSLKIVPAKTIMRKCFWRDLNDGRNMIYVERFDRNRVMSDLFTILRKASRK